MVLGNFILPHWKSLWIPFLQVSNFILQSTEENERGATVLFSSHILGEVQRMCHRVAIIKNGSIVAVQNMQELRENACKKVTLTVRGGCFDAAALPGAANIAQIGNEVSFLYRGDCNALIQILAGYSLDNVEISEPSLEEIFLHYYA